ASYIYDETEEHGLKALARKHLGAAPATYEDTIGDQQSIADVAIKRAAVYACDDALNTYRLHEFYQQEMPDAERQQLVHMESRVALVLADMEQVGVGVDIERLKELGRQLSAEIDTTRAHIIELAGHKFNPNSSQQLATVLYDELGLPCVAQTPSGARSTAAETLEAMGDRHEIVSLILSLRDHEKLISTYVNGLRNSIHTSTGRIHTSFNQAVTRSGRLSSSKPNLQNIPRGDKRIKRAFTPRPGYRFLACDYSQIELRVLAHECRDSAMIQAFDEGKDIHAITAASITDKAINEITEEDRAGAKIVNFGIVYGMTPIGLAKRLEISEEAAARYIDAYFDTYPGVIRLRQQRIEEAHRTGYVETLLGRRRQVTGLDSEDRAVRSRAERVAMNSPVQGGAADLMKLAMLEVHELLRDTPAQILLQIHDELLIEVPEAEIEATARVVKAAMERVYPELLVPLVVDVEIGPSWGELEELGL
ncbi:MAG: DNA polymerase I, partial [Planctomycetes bacterium]|nr:DNA polymerase I [Planctomycetota bacterium]